MTRTTALPAVLAGVLALANAGCAASLRPAFDPRFPDNDAAAVRALMERVRAPAARTDAHGAPRHSPGGARVVACTRGQEPVIIALDLTTGQVRWRTSLLAQGEPVLLDDLVLVTTERELVALDSDVGRVRWRRALANPVFLGAARTGDRVFVATTSHPDGIAASSSQLTALDAGSGRLRWEHRVWTPIGRPSARGDVVLVPWQHQYLVALDAGDGREIARLRAKDHVFEWATMDAGGVLFGHHGVARLRPTYTGALADSEHLALPIEHLPGRPAAMASAFASWPEVGSAHGRVAVHFAMRPTPDLALLDGRIYFVFYRSILALRVDGSLVWARTFEDDIIASEPAPGGLAVVTERGQVLLVAGDTGQVERTQELGAPVALAAIDTATLRVPSPTALAPSLRDGLVALAIDTDSRLLPVRVLAVRALGALPAPDATRDLLDIYAQRSAPALLQRAVADALRSRRVGGEYLVDALLARYDFLERTRPAPLAVIVPALVELGERRATPRLVDLLRDHETPTNMLFAVASALVTLGDASVVDPLHDFLRRYRADSSLADAPEALLEAARGVLQHGGATGHDRIALIAQSSRTPPALASALQSLLDPATQDETPAPTSGSAAIPAPLPEALHQDLVRATFVEHVSDLRDCVLAELQRTPTLARVRLAFIVESDGSTHAWSFVPNRPEFVDCLYPKVRSYRFAPFRAGRQIASYTVAVRPTAALAPAATSEAAGNAAWWQSAVDPHATERGKRPWWRLPDAPFVYLDHIDEPRASPPTAASAASSVDAAQSAPTGTEQPASVGEGAWWLPAVPPAHAADAPHAP